MEFRITFKTPGQYLSTTTLSGVTSEIKEIIERSVLEGISINDPKISKNKIKKEINSKFRLYIAEANKGSWEIVLLSAIGTILAKFAFDIITHNAKYEKLREFINKKLSDDIFEIIKRNFAKKKKLASLKISKNEIVFKISDKGIFLAIINIELEIDQEKIEALELDSNNQIEKYFKEHSDSEKEKPLV